MKKFMRFAMVLALAGSALLYSGCTKDYQKDIDDLNSGVTTLQGTVQKLQEQVSALEALKSQVASLQGDVAPLQAAIDKNTEAIKKLQDGYVTKDELDTELASLKEETLDALADVAIVVADNTEAIAALKEAYKKTDAVAEALNLGKIASVVLVPSDPTGELYENEGFYSEGFYSYKIMYDNGKLYESDPILFLNYKVSPAALAASLDSENTVLHIYGNGTKKWVNLPVNILDADAETGLVSLFVDLDKKNFELEQKYAAYSLEIDSVSEEGVVNKITSAYDFADVSDSSDPIALYYAADFDDIKVPYDKFATSERTFFEGIEFYLTDDAGKAEVTLDDAAAIFDVDVEDITPVFKKALKITENTYIKTDANAWTAKMKAEKLDDAKKAVDASVTATATAYITVNGITKNVWSKDQTYTVVNAEGNDITIDAASLKWTGENYVSTATLWNKSVSKSISKATADSPIYLTRKFKNNAGQTKYNVVMAYADDELATVVPCDTYDTDMPDAVESTNFEKIAFADKAQELGFIGTYIEDNTDYAVSFTLKLDPKPADKKNLDLGTFKVDGSYTKNAVADLGGILKALIGGEEDLYKNVKINVLNTANKLEAELASRLEADVNKTLKVIKETAESSVEVTEDCTLTFEVPTADGNNKNKDKSTLTIEAPTVNGETYVVFFDYTAFGVEYKGSFKVEVSDKGNFALKTTPFVQNGVIKVTYNNAEPDDAAYDGPVKLNKVDFADYFALTSAPENEDVTVSKLKVVITLTDTPYKKGNENKHYVEEPTFDPIVLNVKEKDGKYTSQLKSDSDQIFDWGDFSGREIVAKAQLKRTDNDGVEVSVGDAIEVKLQAVDPFRTFETKDLEINYTPGEPVYINLVDLVKLTSNVDGSALTEFGSAAKAATKDTPAIPFTFSFKSHGLTLDNFGYINDKGKFVNFGDTIDVIVNGEAMPMNITKTAVTKDSKTYNYMLTLPTSSALPDGSQIKFKLGLHTTNICQPTDDQVAEHSGDVTITLKTK